MAVVPPAGALRVPSAAMSLARLRSVAALASWSAALALTGCGDPAPSTPTPTPAPTTPKAADAKPPAPKTEPAAAKAPTDAKAPAPAPAAPAGEDWLVWLAEGDQWVTRWIDAGPRESTLVAERKALVLSDGSTLWRLERKDADVDVKPCECLMEEDAPPDCSPRARLVTPGLRAVELVSGAELVVRPPATEERFGDGIDTSLSIAGGVGSRLFYSWGESGYMCGAHSTIEGASVVFDLATGKPVDDPFSALGRALPVETREPAATEIQARLKDCDGDDAPTVRDLLDGQMGLADLHLALVRGVPTITWHFTADTYYACSPDYEAHGEGTSGLLPAAAPLGLDGPLPGGVTHALARAGEATTVGWAKLSLQGPARAAALEAFRRAPEGAWPPTSASETPIAAGGASKEVSKQARAKLDEGRRQTRAGDYAAAIATFDAAIGLEAGLARAWSERGYAKLLAGDLAGARADLEAALPLDEGAAFRAAIHYNLGQVAERSGDTKAAKASYAASLALRDNETVRKALDRLR